MNTEPGKVLEGVDALKDLQTAQDFYDNRYQSGYMEDDDWPPQKLQRVADLIGELPLPKSGRVLDYGCGTGVFTAVLKKALPGWQIVGTDVSTQALKRAQARLPDCTFIDLATCESKQHEFDLVFSHHVLEHVSDLPHSAGILEKVLTPAGSMLHILPCGNPGSLAHRICKNVRNGIDPARGNRYFFEEVGHLRRLSTDDLVSLWKKDGLGLERAYYAEQFVGAVNAVTQFDLGFVQAFADPGLAATPQAARSLRAVRFALSAIWLMRKPAAVVRYKLRFGCRNLRDYAMLTVGAIAYPFSAGVEWLLRELSAREWIKRRRESGGSEMYVHLTRTAS